MLVQDIEVQLVRPPVSVRRAATGGVVVSAARYRVLSSSFMIITPFVV